MRGFATLVLVAWSVAGAAACSPVGLVIGAGATAGVAAAQERGLTGTSKDFALETEIHGKILADDAKLAAAVGVEVYESIAMLTGTVASEELQAKAIAITWKVEGVKDVFNEIAVAQSNDFFDLSRDVWITAKIKTKLTFDEDIYAINFSITTHNRTVYLMGIAQNQAELDRVIAQARDTNYVRRVISHVRVKPAADPPTS